MTRIQDAFYENTNEPCQIVMIQQGNRFLFSFFKVKKMGISAAKKVFIFLLLL
jgi:hypothetical protein